MFYAVQPKHNDALVYVVAGENKTDALLSAYQLYDPDKYEEELEEAGGFNALAESLLADFYVTEIQKSLVLEYVERRLNGDSNVRLSL